MCGDTQERKQKSVHPHPFSPCSPQKNPNNTHNSQSQKHPWVIPRNIHTTVTKSKTNVLSGLFPPIGAVSKNIGHKHPSKQTEKNKYYKDYIEQHSFFPSKLWTSRLQGEILGLFVLYLSGKMMKAAASSLGYLWACGPPGHCPLQPTHGLGHNANPELPPGKTVWKTPFTNILTEV